MVTMNKLNIELLSQLASELNENRTLKNNQLLDLILLASSIGANRSTKAFNDTDHDHHHSPHVVEYDDTLDILMPLFVGLLVAIILGWMLMRYKMSAHQRSNYNGSIYCCPEECFEFCARFSICKCIQPDDPEIMADNTSKRRVRQETPKGYKYSESVSPNDYSYNSSNGHSNSNSNRNSRTKSSFSQFVKSGGGGSGGSKKSGSVLVSNGSNASFQVRPIESSAKSFINRFIMQQQQQQREIIRDSVGSLSVKVKQPNSVSSSRSSSFKIPEIVTTGPNTPYEADYPHPDHFDEESKMIVKNLNDGKYIYPVAASTPIVEQSSEEQSSSNANSKTTSTSTSGSATTTASTISPPMNPFRFLQRDSVASSSSSSRRNSAIRLPDLMRTNNFTNLYHSFQSGNSTMFG